MAFSGKRVMLSPKLVPPEMFDLLHGALKENGAEVCLCCNPLYNSKDDFHVLPSSDIEKFKELQAQGCNVVGPECVLRCAKERRPFPSVRYTCCLALDGIRIMSTGFEGSERARVQHMVTAMCGELVSKASMDVDVVLAKHVLTPKYKWAVFHLRKPILSMEWLVRCFHEHRRVPHDPYRLPIFAGVVVCTTGVNMEERKKIAEDVTEHGGKLSADLTKDCTHLIAKSTDSEKFKVATNHLTHIKCVTEQWLRDSLSERVCLNEKHYTVQEAGTSYGPRPFPAATFGSQPSQSTNISQEQEPGTTGPVVSASREDAYVEEGRDADPGPSGREEEACDADAGPSGREEEHRTGYLSDIQVYLAGFEPGEMRRLVDIVLLGGGTRYMGFNDRVTHVVVGNPGESDLKKIRLEALWGAMFVVLPSWLEECSRQRREVAVTARFVAPRALLNRQIPSVPGRSKSFSVGEKKTTGLPGRVLERKALSIPKGRPDGGPDFTSSQSNDRLRRSQSSFASGSAPDPGRGMPEMKKRVLASRMGSGAQPMGMNIEPHVSDQFYAKKNDSQSQERFAAPKVRDDGKMPGSLQDITKEKTHPSSMELAGLYGLDSSQPFDPGNFVPPEMGTPAPSAATTSADPNAPAHNKIFEGRVFGFAPSFELSARAEVAQWIQEGGGQMLGDSHLADLREVEFLICPHGPKKDVSITKDVKRVTTQWIKFCLQEGKLQDINSHIVFQPLCCEVPLPGFEGFKFAISQYGDEERMLLYNLCHTLGAKYQMKKMNSTATHLLCKVGDGEKYEAAVNWSIEIVTAEWLYACVTQNMLVSSVPYRVKKLTEADKEAGLAIPTQYPAEPIPFDATNVERLSGQDGTEMPLRSEQHQPEEVETKVKSMDAKRKSISRRRSNSSSRKVEAKSSSKCSLSSQMPVGNLDPWDQLTASWAGETPSKRSTRSQIKGSELLRESPADLVNSESGKVQADPSDDLRNSDQKDEGQDELLVDPDGPQHGEEESGPDVASAIEGLLAQTSKVRSQNGSRSPDLNIWNSDALHGHANFKRPKILSKRSTDNSGTQLASRVTPPEKSDAYEDSLMDSQVVAYGEDHSEKQRIMERVRTRSMSSGGSISGSGASMQGSKVPWKGIDYNRLLKAADANK